MKFGIAFLLALTASVLLAAHASPSLRADAADDIPVGNVSRRLATPTCRIEVGFDYVDNDIGNARANFAEDCCALCNSFPRCRAFSWSGGTCWFKSDRGTVVTNPNVKSSVLVFDPNTPSCSVEVNVDYVDNDIGNAPIIQRAGCCNQCAAFPGCRAWSSNNVNGGTCWFKSAKGRMVFNPNVQSGSPYPNTAQPRCGLELGVDYVGNDIGSIGAPTAGDCCSRCQGWGGCRAFSWTSQGGGTCYLKNLKGATVANANVISAAVFDNPPAPSCALELGVDYVDNDIGNAPSADAYGCCSICMARFGCRAFSWTNLNGGTCWLKSAKGATVANANVKSAVI